MANCGVLARPAGFLKIIQLVIAVVLMALYRNYFINFGGDKNLSNDDRVIQAVTTVCGFFIITAGLFFAHLLPTLVTGGGGVLELLYNTIGAAMYLSTGIFTIIANEGRNQSNEHVKASLAFGSLAIINAGAYILDSFFAWRNRKPLS